MPSLTWPYNNLLRADSASQIPSSLPEVVRNLKARSGSGSHEDLGADYNVDGKLMQ